MENNIGIKRLRGILEDYTEVLPQEYWPVFNYISLQELYEIYNEETGYDPDLFKRLYDAAMYWVKLKLPDYIKIDNRAETLRHRVENRGHVSTEYLAQNIAEYMVMAVEKYVFN